MLLSLLVIAQNSNSLQEFLRDNSPGVLSSATELCLVNNEQRRFGGYSELANSFTQSARGDVVGILHADIILYGADLLCLYHAAKSRVAGIVGRTLEKEYVWGCGSSKDRRVSTLDSCCIFYPKAVPCSFDPVFNSFHCAVEDFCLQASIICGMEIVVPPVLATHKSASLTAEDNSAWITEYNHFRNILAQKWKGVQFETT